MIYTHSEDIEFKYPDGTKLGQWLTDVATSEGKTIGEINIIFCSDDYLLELNKQYLNHDYYTDVITFDYSQDQIISGDIFISIDRVRDNAHTYQQTFEDELNRVIVHGVLHLIGYKDKTDQEQKLMRQKEDFYLKKLSAL